MLTGSDFRAQRATEVRQTFENIYEYMKTLPVEIWGTSPLT